MTRTANGCLDGAHVLHRCTGLLVLALFLALSTGCGGKKETETAESSAPAEQPATEAPKVDAATAATISGSIAFTGSAPKMTLIEMTSEATCHAKSESAPVYTDNVLVNSNGTLRNVFVYVKEGVTGSYPPPADAVTFDQQGCRYTPHVFGIQTGQKLRILNSDEGVLHNIHAFSKLGNGFNFGMPKVMESVKEFKKSEVMVKIKCDVHGWMAAYAGVLDHPFYSVTGEDGSFKLPPLPPGQYVIEAWHEEYGAQTQSVTVAPQETKELSFSFGPSS
jgi:hypothetical protein